MLKIIPYNFSEQKNNSQISFPDLFLIDPYLTLRMNFKSTYIKDANIEKAKL